MFPDRQKSAEVKKEMAAFHHLVGKDEDADALLAKALARAVYRVVVKRPRKAAFIADKAPSYQLEGKSSRYDIYTLKKMPEHLA
jgi:16S rRNA (guanine1516-N2)-methyltransferase